MKVAFLGSADKQKVSERGDHASDNVHGDYLVFKLLEKSVFFLSLVMTEGTKKTAAGGT
jgi:hypothetical protein